MYYIFAIKFLYYVNLYNSDIFAVTWCLHIYLIEAVYRKEPIHIHIIIS